MNRTDIGRTFKVIRADEVGVGAIMVDADFRHGIVTDWIDKIEHVGDDVIITTPRTEITTSIGNPIMIAFDPSED